MRPAAAVLLAAALAGGCETNAGSASPPSLVGTWCSSEDGGRSCWAWDRFEPDGRFEACGRAAGDPRPFRGAGRYTLEGRRMCYVVSEATPNFWLPPGARYCTEIVAIDAGSHRYRDLDGGGVFTLWRRPDAQRDCPAR